MKNSNIAAACRLGSGIYYFFIFYLLLMAFHLVLCCVWFYHIFRSIWITYLRVC